MFREQSTVPGGQTRRFVVRRTGPSVAEPMTVADGALWPDDTVSIRWRGEHRSTVFWLTYADAVAVHHGNDGTTEFVWLDA